MALKGMSVFTNQGEDFTINDPNIADEFSTLTDYVKGQFVNHSGDLYRFKTNHPAGAWNSGHVTKVKLSDVFKETEDAINEGIAETNLKISQFPEYTIKKGSWGNSDNTKVVLAGFFKPNSRRIKFHTNRPLTAEGNYYKIGICEYNDSPYGNTRKTYSDKIDANMGFRSNHIFELHSDTLAISFQLSEYNSSDEQLDISPESFASYYIWVEDYGYDELKKETDYIAGGKTYCEIGNGTVPNTENTYCVRTVNFIPCNEGYIVFLNPTRPVLAPNNKYFYGYSIYNSEKTEILRKDIYTNQTNFNYVEIPQNGKFIRFSVGEVDAEGNIVTLRIASFVGYTIDVYVQSSKAFLEYISESIMSKESENEFLPQYWTDYLNNKIASINLSVSDNAGFTGSSFYFLTDIHWSGNEKYSPAIIRWLRNRTPVQDIIQGGDILDRHNTRAAAMLVLEDYLSTMREMKAVNMVGNHDNNSNGQPDATEKFVGEGTFFRLLNSETEKSVTWEPSTNYGYSDNSVQKIRYFFLDTGTPDLATIDQDQLDWLGGKIRELDSSWTVVVFGHMFLTPRTAEYQDLVMNGSGWAVSGLLNTIAGEDNRPTIAAMICGHTHRDYSLKPYDTFPVICTTCDAGARRVGNDPNTRYVAGTTTAQAFDIFCINTEEKTINAIRIGDGNDREWTY